MTEETKRQSWIAPSIRRYGKFETATQGCDKKLGDADGFTFMGQTIVCAS